MNTSNDARAILDEYTKSLEEGRTGNCEDPKLESAMKTELLERGTYLHDLLQWDVFSILHSSQSEKQPLTKTLEIFIKAFEVLELAAVNIYAFPWRKEFKIIKTFSGTYVHYFKPVLADHDIAKVLKMMGYCIKDEYHLELVCLPPVKELAKLACGFYVARLECILLLDIVQKLDHGKVALTDLIQERKVSRSIDECVDRLKNLYRHQMACSKHAEDLVETVVTGLEAAVTGDALDLYTDKFDHLSSSEGRDHSDSRLSTTSSKMDSSGEPFLCDRCEEDWSVHCDGFCPRQHPDRQETGTRSLSAQNGRLVRPKIGTLYSFCEKCHHPSQYHSQGLCPIFSHESGAATCSFMDSSSNPERITYKTCESLGENLEFYSGYYNMQLPSPGGRV